MGDSEALTVILSRLAHQDKTLDEIKANQSEMKIRLDTHMELEERIRPAVMELVNILHGSKILSRGALWVAGLVGSVWALLVWAKDHIKL